MSAELTAAPEGQKRHPWDWYVELPWVTHRLCDFVPFEANVTYLDPACGMGNITRALTERGLRAYGTDRFQRTDHKSFLGTHDFLGDQRHMLEAEPALSIVMNAPYSVQDGALVPGLAERFVRRSIDLATHKVAALLPIKWLASKGRARLFAEHMPAGIYILCERPSMPPGDQIAAMGKAAHRGGKVDYMWVVWDHHAPKLPYAPTIWIPARKKTSAAPFLERAA